MRRKISSILLVLTATFLLVALPISPIDLNVDSVVKLFSNGVGS